MRELELDELDLVCGGSQAGSDGPSGVFRGGQMSRRARAGSSSGSDTFTLPGLGTFPGWHPRPTSVTMSQNKYTAFASLAGWVGISANFGKSAEYTWSWDSSCNECH